MAGTVLDRFITLVAFEEVFIYFLGGGRWSVSLKQLLEAYSFCRVILKTTPRGSSLKIRGREKDGSESRVISLPALDAAEHLGRYVFMYLIIPVRNLSFDIWGIWTL